MIIVDDKKEGLPPAEQPDDSDIPPAAGPSTVAPPATTLNSPPLPTFQEATEATALVRHDFADSDIFVPPGGEEPPPNFAPYEAEFFETNDGDVISHDPHLNEDGEALYRFLLARSQVPPKFLLHLHGDHVEQCTRQVQRTDSHGRTHWHTETDTRTVTDFDFQVDISHHIGSIPIHWTIPDSEPAYRGKMYQEVDVTTGEVPMPGSSDVEVAGAQRVRRKASRLERKSAKVWNHERQVRGLPPWIGPEAGWSIQVVRPAEALIHQTSANVLKSSKTVREWADEYCASPKLLKEFTYERIVYGWNCAALEAAIVAAVQSTYYNGNLQVNFIRRSRKIHVRADNWLSRALSHTWIKVILWILLLYPFIWLFKRFAEEGGGRWEVCGGAYALKAWQFVTGTNAAQNQDLLPEYTPEDSGVVQTNMGAARLVGVKEGEWFAKWEGTIKRAVLGRLQSRKPLVEPDIAPPTAALLLEGYVRQPDAF